MKPRKLFALACALMATACADPVARPAPPPPRADFKVLEVKAVDPLDRGIAPEADIDLAIALVNDYYNAAFFIPRPVTGTFTAEAKPAALANMSSLTIGDLSRDVARITPSRQEITRASFLLEADSSVAIALVEMSFEATASLKRGQSKRAPVRLVHTAKFWLEKQDGVFKISAFSAKLKADTIAQSPKPKRKKR